MKTLSFNILIIPDKVRLSRVARNCTHVIVSYFKPSKAGAVEQFQKVCILVSCCSGREFPKCSAS